MITTIKKAVVAAGLVLAVSLFAAQPGVAQEQEQLRYGPIQQTDTLWRIASRNRPDDSVTVHQVMAAILDTNPEAFRNNSIHYMLTGFYLDIPSLETIQAYNADQARESIIEQLEQPAAVQQAAAEAVSESPASPSEAEPEQRTETTEPAATQIAQVSADLESQLEVLKERVDESMSRAESLAADNDEIHQRLSNVTDLIDEVRESVQSNAEIEREVAEIQRQQRELQREQNRVSSQTKWSTPPWVIVPLAILGIIFLLLIIWIVRRCRPEKHQEPTPYQAATATHMAGSVDSENEQDAETSDSSEVERQKSDQQEFEGDEEPSANEDAAPEPSETKSEDEEFFRDIDEILAEADAAADEDDEPEAIDSSQSEKEQLAAELDLARAYLEMDEKEEARDIIRKVLEKADDELKAEAETLLKRIDES